MAVPNYTYLKLKMPGPNGVITVGPTYRHAFNCDVECVEYAEALAESEALIADLESLSKEVPDVKRHAGNFEPAETVKSAPLDPSSDASKQIRIELTVGVSNPGVPGPTSYRRVPQPRWVGARQSAKGGGSQRETGVRGGIPRPSCLSHAQVGCACSRGLQASTREGASGLTRAPSRPSPRGQPS
jgi:hypothetical protein